MMEVSKKPKRPRIGESQEMNAENAHFEKVTYNPNSTYSSDQQKSESGTATDYKEKSYSQNSYGNRGGYNNYNRNNYNNRQGGYNNYNNRQGGYNNYNNRQGGYNNRQQG